MRRKSSRGRLRASPTSEAQGTAPNQSALDDLIWTALFLYFRLSAAATYIYQQGEFSGGKGSVLRNLALDGPATVPQLARLRPVSRQFMLKLTNQMAAEGLLSHEDNPNHRRSKLLCITPRGRAVLARISKRWSKVARWLGEGMNERDVIVATRVLKQIRDRMARTSEWRAALDAPARRRTGNRPRLRWSHSRKAGFSE